MVLIPSDMAARLNAEKMRRSFSFYIRNAWPQTEPGEFISGWHIDAIARHLEAVKKGDIKRLLVNIPPRFMKSLQISVMFPTWEWLDRPATKYLTASYADELAVRDAVKSRDIIKSNFYQRLLEHLYDSETAWKLKGDQNAKSRYENTAGGHRIATSVGGAATGDGGDRIIVDDPLSAAQGHSKAARDSAIIWWDQTMASRLNDKATGAKIVVMQRLHENDLTGHILSQTNEYDHLVLPLEYSPKIIIAGKEFAAADYKTSIGWSDPRTEPGACLWPERFSPAIIKQTKLEMGPYGYAGQYLQNPAPLEGGMMKRHWWRFYTALPANLDRILAPGDMAFKDTVGSDFVAGEVWGFKGADSFLIDGINEKMDFEESKKAVVLLQEANPKTKNGGTLIEDKANGPAIISTLGRTVRGLIPIQPAGGKIARVNATIPSLAAGNIWLPDPQRFPKMAPFVKAFIEQAAGFPNATHDDMVDSFSQAHIWAWENGQPRFITGNDLYAAQR